MSAKPNRVADVDVASDTASLELLLPPRAAVFTSGPRLAGKKAGMVVFSLYPADPRPRRAAEALLKEGMSRGPHM